MTHSDLLDQIRADIQALTKDLNKSSIGEIVDAGTVLSGILAITSESLEEVKTLLREAAMRTLNHEPGVATFTGPLGQAVVTVPPPRMVLMATSDAEVLRGLLGDQFNDVFEERVTHVPRKNAAEQILNLPPGPARDALLGAVAEKEQTPRVGFKKG